MWCVVAATSVGDADLIALLPNINRVDDANGPSVHSRGVVKPYRVSQQAQGAADLLKLHKEMRGREQSSVTFRA